MGLRSTHKIDAGFSLSSMTDLVFLLLIFFVIVSTMVSPYAVPVELPKGKKGSSTEKPKVVLRVAEGNAFSVNGSGVTVESLEATLKAEMAKHPAEQPILLYVEQTAGTGAMVTALDVAKRNKWRIVLAAQSSPPPVASPSGTAPALPATP